MKSAMTLMDTSYRLAVWCVLIQAVPSMSRGGDSSLVRKSTSPNGA